MTCLNTISRLFPTDNLLDLALSVLANNYWKSTFLRICDEKRLGSKPRAPALMASMSSPRPSLIKQVAFPDVLFRLISEGRSSKAAYLQLLIHLKQYSLNQKLLCLLWIGQIGRYSMFESVNSSRMGLQHIKPIQVLQTNLKRWTYTKFSKIANSKAVINVWL